MEKDFIIADNGELITFTSFMQRLIEIWRDCSNENYLCEIFIPFLKMCCIEGTKIVPVFDDRAMGPKPKNETDHKKHMKTIGADKGDGEYIVPDYIFVPADYTYFNSKKPYLMVEAKAPAFLKDGKCYRDLEDSIQYNKIEIDAEIEACNKGYVLYTDGITWMFLKHEGNKIVESKDYPTIRLVNKFEPYHKTKYIELKKETKHIDLSFMGAGIFDIETDPKEWNKLQEQIKKLLREILEE